MNRTRPFRPIRRLAGILAALAATLLAAATAAPAAFALPVPPVGGGDGTPPPRCRPSSSAACPAGRSPSSPWPPRSLAAAVAVLLDRARTAHRHQAAPSA